MAPLYWGERKGPSRWMPSTAAPPVGPSSMARGDVADGPGGLLLGVGEDAGQKAGGAVAGVEGRPAAHILRRGGVGVHMVGAVGVHVQEAGHAAPAPGVQHRGFGGQARSHRLDAAVPDQKIRGGKMMVTVHLCVFQQKIHSDPSLLCGWRRAMRPRIHTSVHRRFSAVNPQNRQKTGRGFGGFGEGRAGTAQAPPPGAPGRGSIGGAQALDHGLAGGGAVAGQRHHTAQQQEHRQQRQQGRGRETVGEEPEQFFPPRDRPAARRRR